MPKAADQSMFTVEPCNHCDDEVGAIYMTARGKYLWRCETCGGCWITPGSEMEVYNALIGHGRVNRGITIDNDPTNT